MESRYFIESIFIFFVSITLTLINEYAEAIDIIPVLGKECTLGRCIGRNVECDMGNYMCVCNTNYPVEVVRKCWKAQQLEESCTHTEQCEHTDSMSFCSSINDRCQCKEGYYAVSKQHSSTPYCAQGEHDGFSTDMNIYLIVMVVGLLIASVFVYFGIAKFCERIRTTNRDRCSINHTGTTEARPYADCEAISSHADPLPPSYTQAVIATETTNASELEESPPPPSYEDAIKEELEINKTVNS